MRSSSLRAIFIRPGARATVTGPCLATSAGPLRLRFVRSTGFPHATGGSFAGALRSELRRLIAESAHMLVWWAAITALAVVGALGARGSGYHQLAIAALLASATLFVLLSLTEIVWRILYAIAESLAGTK